MISVGNSLTVADGHEGDSGVLRRAAPRWHNAGLIVDATDRSLLSARWVVAGPTMRYRTWNWPLIVYLLMLGLSISVAMLDTLEPRFCEPGKLGSAAAQQNVVVFTCWEFWLNRYQTLLAGTLALLAASASVFYLRMQISQAEQHRQDQLLRDRAAARTVLPLALSTICEYATRSVQSLNERYAGRSTELPDIPAAALEQLVATVRTLEIQHVKPFAKIAQEIQVHNARISGRRDRRRMNEMNLHESLLDAAEIYARASCLFDFARFENDDLPSELFADQMKSALWSTAAEYDRQGPLHQAIDRRERMYPRRSTEEAND